MNQKIILGWRRTSGFCYTLGYVRLEMEGDRELMEDFYEYVKKFKPKKQPEFAEFIIE